MIHKIHIQRFSNRHKNDFYLGYTGYTGTYGMKICFKKTMTFALCQSAICINKLVQPGASVAILSSNCKWFEPRSSVNCDRPGECSPEKDCLR